MKKIWAVIVCVILTVFLAVPVWAEDNLTGSDIQVTDYTGTKPFERDGQKVYSISSQKRDRNGVFEQTKDQVFTLKSVTTDMHGITVEMKTQAGKNDIAVKVIKISEDGLEAQISINFSSRKVSTSLNMDDAVVVKKDGQVLQRILFAYSTPYFQDEHYDGFNSLTPWSGTWEYEDGISFKLSGMIDVYEKTPILTYTYTAEGKQGVKAFRLDPGDNFTFLDGSTIYTNINHQPKASNTIHLKCSASYVSKLKEELIKEMSYDEDNWQMNVVFDDVIVEYEDGCYIGEANDPIYLGHAATLKPLGKINLEVSLKSAASIKLQWNKTKSVNGYCIYRSQKKNGTYKKIKTVSSQTLSYTDKKLKTGKSYFYKIRSYRDVRYKSSNGQWKVKRLYGSYSNVNQAKTAKAGSKSASAKTTQKNKTVKNSEMKLNSKRTKASPRMGDESMQNIWLLLVLSGIVTAGTVYKKKR